MKKSVFDESLKSALEEVRKSEKKLEQVVHGKAGVFVDGYIPTLDEMDRQISEQARVRMQACTDDKETGG